jgi:hypothetical protein
LPVLFKGEEGLMNFIFAGRFFELQIHLLVL